MPSRKDYSPDKYGNFRVFKDMIKKNHNNQHEHFNAKVEFKPEEELLVKIFKQTGHSNQMPEKSEIIQSIVPLFYDKTTSEYKTFHKENLKKHIIINDRELKAIYDSTIEALKKYYKLS